jgi:acetyl-CoA C-acetyltransferase
LCIDLDKLNVNGGAIAIGHPFGMTGARITRTLINSLQFHDKQFGLETLCVGGGQGMAIVIHPYSVNCYEVIQCMRSARPSRRAT